MHSYLLKYRQLGDNKPYTPANLSESNNKQLYGSNFYRINFLICTLDCHGLVCLYNGIIDLNSCQCKCDLYDEIKKYYNSIELLTDIKIQTIKITQSILSLGNNSISSVFIQLIIVLFVLFLIK